MKPTLALLLALASGTAGARTLVTGASDFYVVSADLDRNGAYTVGTGPSHPVTLQEGQATTVLRGGSNFISGISFNAVRSYDSRTDYFMGMPGFVTSVEPGYDCMEINDAATPSVEMIADGGREVGFVIRWLIDRPPDNLLVEQRLVSRGVEFTDSVAEITLSVTNLGAADASIGLRYAWSLALGNSGGSTAPTIAPKPPEPIVEPLPASEFAVAVPSFRSYIVSNERSPSSPGPVDDNTYVIEATMAAIPLDPPPTPPDRFLYTPFGQALLPVDARTAGPLNACFTYAIADPPRPVFNASTSGAVYFWGETPAAALVVPPGGTASVTQYIFAYLEFPLACDAGGSRTVECDGATTTVELDGAGSRNNVDGVVEYLWTTEDPAVLLEDERSAQPLARVTGLGPHEVHLLAHRGGFATSCSTLVEVVDTTPPLIRAARVTPGVLWPPDHRFVPVHVELDAQDLCAASSEIRLVSVTSSERDEARRGGDGHTLDDIREAEIGTADFDILLRAERQGRLVGRTYTLLYEARDAAGNAVEIPLKVQVPHDQRPARRSR